eukprot:gene1820-33238_t
MRWLLDLLGKDCTGEGDCSTELESFQGVVNELQGIVPVASVTVNAAQMKLVSRYDVDTAKLKSNPCKLQLVLLPFGTEKEDLDDYLVWDGAMESKALTAWITEAMPIMASEVDAMNFNMFVQAGMEPSPVGGEPMVMPKAGMEPSPSGGEPMVMPKAGMEPSLSGRVPMVMPKAILFTNKEEIPGIYKALALNNRNASRLGFGWCRTTAPEAQDVMKQFNVVKTTAPEAHDVIKQFKVVKVPSLRMLLPVPLSHDHPEYVEGQNKMGMTVQPYQGPLKYRLMKQWVEQLYTMWEQVTGMGSKDAPALESVAKAEDKESFAELCSKGSSCMVTLLRSNDEDEVEDANDIVSAGGICMVTLLRGNDEDEVEDAMEIVSAVAHKRATEPLAFVWADVTVHKSLLATFGIRRSDCPTVVAFSQKRLRYATMDRSLNSEALNSFIDGVLSGKIRTEELSAAPVLSSEEGPTAADDAAADNGDVGVEEEIVEDEFDLSDIMDEEVDGSFETAAQRLRRVEEELAAEEAKKAEGDKSEKKKKKKKKDKGGKKKLNKGGKKSCKPEQLNKSCKPEQLNKSCKPEQLNKGVKKSCKPEQLNKSCKPEQLSCKPEQLNKSCKPEQLNKGGKKKVKKEL